MITIMTRPLQDVDVLGFLNFKILAARPETPGFHSRPIIKYGGQDENKDARLKRREREPQRSSMARMSTS